MLEGDDRFQASYTLKVVEAGIVCSICQFYLALGDIL